MSDYDHQRGRRDRPPPQFDRNSNSGRPYPDNDPSLNLDGYGLPRPGPPRNAPGRFDAPVAGAGGGALPPGHAGGPAAGAAHGGAHVNGPNDLPPPPIGDDLPRPALKREGSRSRLPPDARPEFPDEASYLGKNARDLEAKDQPHNRRFRDKRDGYESEEGETHRRMKDSNRGGRRPPPGYPDDDDYDRAPPRRPRDYDGGYDRDPYDDPRDRRRRDRRDDRDDRDDRDGRGPPPRDDRDPRGPPPRDSRGGGRPSTRDGRDPRDDRGPRDDRPPPRDRYERDPYDDRDPPRRRRGDERDPYDDEPPRRRRGPAVEYGSDPIPVQRRRSEGRRPPPGRRSRRGDDYSDEDDYDDYDNDRRRPPPRRQSSAPPRRRDRYDDDADSYYDPRDRDRRDRRDGRDGRSSGGGRLNLPKEIKIGNYDIGPLVEKGQKHYGTLAPIVAPLVMNMVRKHLSK